MSDNMLSQEEIDALLNGTADTPSSTEDEQLLPEEDLDSMEVDALGEIGNISFGSSATTLSTLLNQKVEITTPKTAVIKRSDLYDKFPQPNVAIQVSYTEGFSGANLFVIKQSDAAIIADLMLGGDGNAPAEEFNEIHQSAVQEAMNQMMGAAATSMSTVFSKKIDISPPSLALMDLSAGTGADKLPEDEQLVSVSFDLRIGNLIDSIMQLLSTDFAKDMVNELLQPAPEEPEGVAVYSATSRLRASLSRLFRKHQCKQCSKQYRSRHGLLSLRRMCSKQLSRALKHQQLRLLNNRAT